MKMPKYECLGGPMDGRRVARMPRTNPCQAFTCAEMNDGVTTLHFYRLCVSTIYTSFGTKQARFWHYIGTDPDIHRRPTLKPSRSMFK